MFAPCIVHSVCVFRSFRVSFIPSIFRFIHSFRVPFVSIQIVSTRFKSFPHDSIRSHTIQFVHSHDSIRSLTRLQDHVTLIFVCERFKLFVRFFKKIGSGKHNNYVFYFISIIYIYTYKYGTRNRGVCSQKSILLFFSQATFCI